jgi:hypothetical protein
MMTDNGYKSCRTAVFQREVAPEDDNQVISQQDTVLAAEQSQGWKRLQRLLAHIQQALDHRRLLATAMLLSRHPS